jgi:hypothetical protein
MASVMGAEVVQVRSMDAKRNKRAGDAIRPPVAFREDTKAPPALFSVCDCPKRHIQVPFYEYFILLVFYISGRLFVKRKNRHF